MLEVLNTFLGVIHFPPLAGSERWSVDFTYTLPIWFCDHPPNSSDQGGHFSSHKEAGKSVRHIASL
jgi:hypothetical protein